jgi:hypothetical protein
LIVVTYYDWFGTPEGLKEFETEYKKSYEKTPGTKYLGRYGAANRKYHWASIAEVKDWPTFQKLNENFSYKRSYKDITHWEYEFFL